MLYVGTGPRLLKKEENVYMDDSQPKRVLEHLHNLCQSLKATNRISLHIRMMNILYEFIQTIGYFRFLLDKLKAAPILDIDRDVDYLEWANKEWIDSNNYSLLWEDQNTYDYNPNDMEVKNIVDYLFLRDEKLDRKRRDNEEVIEMRKELSSVADSLRTSIDVMLGHSAITTNTIKEGIAKAIEELKYLLLEINDFIGAEAWSDEQYTDLVYRYMPKVTEKSVQLRMDYKNYKAQKRHETLRDDFFMNKLREELAVFIKSDFLISDYLGDDYNKEDGVWKKLGMESRRDIDNDNLYKKRLYILSEMVNFRGKWFDFYNCPKLGIYLFYNRKEITAEKLNSLKRFYVMSTVISDDWDEFNNVPITRTDRSECEFSEEQIKSSNIPNNAWLFLTLTKKIIPKNSDSLIWVYVYGLLKTSDRFGYKGSLKEFQQTILCSIFDFDITYDALKKAKSRAQYINNDYTLQENAYRYDSRIAQLYKSIEAHFRKRVEEITGK